MVARNIKELITFKEWRAKHQTILSDNKYLPEVTGVDDWLVLEWCQYDDVKKIIQVSELRTVYGTVDHLFRNHRFIQMSVRDDATDYVAAILISPKVAEHMRSSDLVVPMPNKPPDGMLN